MSNPVDLDTSVTMPRNFLRPCLLLALAEGTAHGYELLERVTGLGLVRPDPGRLYRCLRAMDEEGLIDSHWEPSTLGPARRTYTLTGAGWSSLEAAAAGVVDVAEVLDLFGRRYRDVAGRGAR